MLDCVVDIISTILCNRCLLASVEKLLCLVTNFTNCGWIEELSMTAPPCFHGDGSRVFLQNIGQLHDITAQKVASLKTLLHVIKDIPESKEHPGIFHFPSVHHLQRT